jgi:hypothetical protein
LDSHALRDRHGRQVTRPIQNLFVEARVSGERQKSGDGTLDVVKRSKIALGAILAAASAQSPRFEITHPSVDQEGVATEAASVCIVSGSSRQCYTPPKPCYRGCVFLLAYHSRRYGRDHRRAHDSTSRRRVSKDKRLLPTLSILLLGCLVSPGNAFAKNRDPKDYPQKAKVISFQRQPCLRQHGTITRVCHLINFQLDEQTLLTGSCSRRDPLLRGETYPARLDRKDLVLYVIHQKTNGSWGQDDYSVTEMGSEPPANPH